MFPLMLVLIFLSISTVVPWVIAALIWRQRRFMPLAAPWFALANIFAGGEAVMSMIALISRNPRTVFWAEAGFNLSAALTGWAFFMAMLSLIAPARGWLWPAGVLGFLFTVPPWLGAVRLMLPRLHERAYMIYHLGDYPVIRFFVRIPPQVEVLIFVLPGIVFAAGMALAVGVYRNSFVRQRMPMSRLVLLFLFAGAVVFTHWLHLRGQGIFAALDPMPALIWTFALALAWLVLSQHFGLVMPFVGPDVLERSREGIIVADRAERLAWWNETARRWLSLGSEAAIGRPVREILAPYPALQEVLDDPETEPREVRLEHPERGEVFLEAYSLLATGRSGLHMGRTLIFYDLTPWRKLQQRDAFRAESESLARDLFALIVEQVPLEPALRRAAAYLRRPLGRTQPQGVGLWLLDAEAQRLERVAWQGDGPEPADSVEADPTWWETDATRPAPAALASSLVRVGARHAWALPLRHGETPLGMLVLETAEPPSDEVRAVWRTAANTIALLVRRRRDAQRLHLMQAVYENIQEIVIVFDAHGFVLDHNPAAARWWGTDALKGRHGEEILPVDAELRAQIMDTLAQRGMWMGTLETTLPSGQAAIVEMSLVRMPETVGEMGVAVIRDVTERERLRQDLERQKTFLEDLLRIGRTLLAAPLSVSETWRAVLRVGQDLLDASNASLILVDENLRVTEFFVEEEIRLPQEAYQSMAQEVIDRGFAGQALRARRILYTPDVEHDPRWIYAETLPWRSVVSVPLFYQERPLGVMTFSSEQKHHFRPEHLRLLDAAADMIALAVYNARLYEEQFRLGRELLRAKEEAEDLRRRQETFFANLSHEMRTPLQAILGYLEWLRMAAEGCSPYDAELQQIEAAAQRLLSIVNLMLEYRRSQEDDRLLLETFPLAEMVDEVRSLVAPLARRNNDRLEVDLEPEDLTLHSDRQKVLHILLNLVSNAIKFTENGRVVIRGRVETDDQGREWVRLEVEDTGIGIPADALSTIFEPFRQAEGEATRRRGGTGLGLALVKRYTERLGGRVEVHSRVGQGSRFVVHLPRVLTNEPPASEESAS